MRGHIPPPPGALSMPPLGIGGPIARSAADLDLALDVLVAPSEPDRAAWQLRIPPSRHEKLSDFRVALWADQKSYSVDRRCLEAMQAYAQDLRRLGVEVDEGARPNFDPRASDDLYVAMLIQHGIRGYARRSAGVDRTGRSGNEGRSVELSPRESPGPCG